MPIIEANGVKLNYEEHGHGDNVVVYIHGNLGCIDWMDLVWPRLPEDLKVIAIEWRGCGLSEKPIPDEDYSNYSMTQHASDMIAAIQNLGIKFSDICGHSTGGIIALHMMRMMPDMFGKLLVLDPVGPMGLDMTDDHKALFAQMKDSRDVAKAALSSALPTLFNQEHMAKGIVEFSETATEDQKALFERLVDKTRDLSDGIWFGTAHNLAKEFQNAVLRSQQESMQHPVLILWGELDSWIPREHMEEMATRMPNCKLVVVPGVGHSMCVEQPDVFAQHFKEFFLQPLGGEKATNIRKSIFPNSKVAG